MLFPYWNFSHIVLSILANCFFCCLFSCSKLEFPTELIVVMSAAQCLLVLCGNVYIEARKHKALALQPGASDYNQKPVIFCVFVEEIDPQPPRQY